MRHCRDNFEEIEQFYQRIKTQLKKWRTEPGLARLWVATLKGQQHTYAGTETNTKWIQELQTEQSQLGIPQLWTGFLTQKWGDIQEAYHRREKQD